MISEERLRLSARRAGEALADSLPAPEDCRHSFSPAFEKKMARLIRRTRHRGFYTGMKRAASFVLAVLLSGGLWLTVDAQARETFFGWVSQQVEDAQRYFNPGPVTPIGEIVPYRLTVPAGYQLEARTIRDASGEESYTTADGTPIHFTWQYAAETAGGEVYVLDSGSHRKRVTVHGMPADLYLSASPDTSNTILWTDEDTGALLHISAVLDEDDLLKLAEAVTRE